VSSVGWDRSLTVSSALVACALAVGCSGGTSNAEKARTAKDAACGMLVEAEHKDHAGYLYDHELAVDLARSAARLDSKWAPFEAALSDYESTPAPVPVDVIDRVKAYCPDW
jgi:hypothetical protein